MRGYSISQVTASGHACAHYVIWDRGSQVTARVGMITCDPQRERGGVFFSYAAKAERTALYNGFAHSAAYATENVIMAGS